MRKQQQPPELIIEAGRTEQQYWQDLWRYRELFYFLAWRDILVRYKQTVIGIAWALIRPFLTMIVFTVVFGRLAKLPSEGVPYPILVFAAMLPWQFFANALSECSNSLISNANLLSKVYFPRLIRANQRSDCQFRRFFDIWDNSVGINGLVQFRTQLANSNLADFYFDCFFCCYRSGSMVSCIKRPVPRFSLYRSIYCSIRVIRFTRWFQQ